MHSDTKKRFIKDALILSIVNIAMKAVAVGFNAYINRKIGAEGMGLLTLVMSVYGFAVTVALSCVNLSAVKLTSEKVEQLDGCDVSSYKKTMHGVVRSVSLYSLLFGVSAGCLLFLFSEPIALHLLKDSRTLPSLRALAVSLPAISLSSALSGYFTGIRKVRKNAVVAVSEQFIKIILTSAFLVMIVPGDLETACLAVVGGSALAEALSFLLQFFLYLFDCKYPSHRSLGNKQTEIKTRLSEVFGISLPSAIGTYARQGLTTVEHLEIPKGIIKSGLTREAALTSYGLLQGIAFPLVMFPYAVIGSFTTLLIPEIASRNQNGDDDGIRRLTREVYRYSALFSVFACFFFVSFANELGELIYSTSDAAGYTLSLGLLVPFMYLDTAVDSLLKGLGKQVYIMGVNIADAASGVLFVILLTPIFGIRGYIWTLWICEIGNLAASIYKLNTVTGLCSRDVLKEYAYPAFCALSSFAVNRFLIPSGKPVVRMMLFILLYCALILAQRKKPKEKKKAVGILS